MNHPLSHHGYIRKITTLKKRRASVCLAFLMIRVNLWLFQEKGMTEDEMVGWYHQLYGY